MRTDLLDAEAAAVLGHATAVVHLAGCPGVRDDRPDAGRWRWRDNVLATQAVLDATPRDVPLVVTSSSSVYGGAGSPTAPRACRETDTRRPRGGYARSKAAVEDLCAAASAAGRPVGVLRPFTVAGEGQRPDMALARWIEAVRAGRPVHVFGSLDRRRDVTDARDVARAAAAALSRGLDGPCNVGTGTTHRLGDLLDAVVDVVGRPADVRVVPAAREEVAATRADTTRCHDVLGAAAPDRPGGPRRPTGRAPPPAAGGGLTSGAAATRAAECVARRASRRDPGRVAPPCSWPGPSPSRRPSPAWGCAPPMVPRPPPTNPTTS